MCIKRVYYITGQRRMLFLAIVAGKMVEVLSMIFVLNGYYVTGQRSTQFM